MFSFIIVLIIVVCLSAIIILCFKKNVQPFDSNPMIDQIFLINMEKSTERLRSASIQLNELKLPFVIWKATDGFRSSDDEMRKHGVHQELISRARGLAGCAASHLSLWKHIAEKNIKWSLVLEDDFVFHPDFDQLLSRFIKYVPHNAKIIFPGWCGGDEHSNEPISCRSAMCTHCYIISNEGAKDLLSIQAKMPIDIEINNFYDTRPKCESVVFNGAYKFEDIPKIYDEKGSKECYGIVYQDRKNTKSTVHGDKSIF